MSSEDTGGAGLDEEPPPGVVVLDRYGDAFQRDEHVGWLPAQASGADLHTFTWEGLQRVGAPLTVLVPAALVVQARDEGEATGRRAILSRLRDLANMAEPDGQDATYQVLSINLRWAADQIERRGTPDHD